MTSLICVIAVPRTGSNRLCSLLEVFPEIRVKYEIFHPDRAMSLEWESERLAPLAGLPGAPVHDPDLVSWVRAHPAQVLDFLIDLYPRHKYVTFKLFPGHLTRQQFAETVVTRDDVAFIVLSRRAIDTFTSYLKAERVGAYAGVDTTSMKVTADASNFARRLEDWRSWYDFCLQQIASSSRPAVFMTYESCLRERDMTAIRLLVPYINSLGHAVRSPPVPQHLTFAAQDRSSTPSDRIENWHTFRGDLKAAGLYEAAFRSIVPPFSVIRALSRDARGADRSPTN